MPYLVAVVLFLHRTVHYYVYRCSSAVRYKFAKVCYHCLPVLTTTNLPNLFFFAVDYSTFGASVGNKDPIIDRLDGLSATQYTTARLSHPPAVVQHRSPHPLHQFRLRAFAPSSASHSHSASQPASRPRLPAAPSFTSSSSLGSPCRSSLDAITHSSST